MTLDMMESHSELLKCVLLQTSSEDIKLYFKDKLRDMYSCSLDTIIEVKNATTLRTVRDLANSAPFMADKWLIVVELGKLKKELIKTLLQIIKASTDAVFLCYVDKYVIYKDFKNSLKNTEGFLDYYLTYLKYADIDYLYEDLVPEENKMPDKLYAKFKKGYSSDVDAVIRLFREMKEGTKITKQKQITEICGLGGNTINTFVFSLLKDAPTTEKGMLAVIRNRAKSAYDLKEDYTWGQMWGYCKKSLESIRDVKMLCISDEVYKSLKKVPDGYDEKSLMRFQRYLFTIKDIPFSRVLRLLDLMSKNRWSNEQCFLAFLYNYYKELVVTEVVKTKVAVAKIQHFE